MRYKNESVLRNHVQWLLREGNRLYSYHLSRVQSHPPNYTTYYLTLKEPESNTSTSYSGTSNLINLHTDNNASQYVDNSKFWLEAGLPIWRWQSVSGWLSCLLGKDSRLYSYLKKRLHNPTTIQSTTSAPRTAFTLLLHQRSFSCNGT